MSEENNLPAVVPPNGKHLHVDVALKERTVLEPEAIEALKRAGLTKISDHTMSDLQSIGIHVKGVGVITIQTGGAVLNQQRLELVMRELFERLFEPVTTKGKQRKITNAEALRIASVIALLSGKKTESQQMVIDAARAETGGGAIEEPEAPRTQAFTPGMKVQPAGTTQVFTKEAHFHNTPPETPAQK